MEHVRRIHPLRTVRLPPVCQIAINRRVRASFEVRTNHQARYLEIRYRGAVTAAERLEALEEVFSKDTTVEFHRVLIVFRDAHCVSEDFAASNRVAARLARATVD